MAPRLIVNADDFGLTRGINRAIAELHRAGVLHSTTLMANGPAFDDAVAIARAHPGLGVGCHVVLTGGTPVSPPRTVPSLLDTHGRHLRPSLPGFVLAVLLGQLSASEAAVSEADVEREATAQIRKLQQAGIAVTHLDTHKHTHVLPAVARPLLRAAAATGVPAVRNPFEDAWSRRLSRSTLPRAIQLSLARCLRARFLALPQLRSGALRTTAGSIGIAATGSLDAATLRALLAALPDGLWELVCHPGYSDAALDAISTRLRGQRAIERDALLAVLGELRRRPSAPGIVDFRVLARSSPLPAQPPSY
jgi:predicted glycoside hydrolase/deacetylase ChbG (UPF0249 family)